MNKIILIIIIAASLAMQSCGKLKSSSGGNNTSGVNIVNKNIFGVNMPWENLSDSCVSEGELIQDRSFRINSTGVSDIFGNPADTAWKEYTETGGTNSYSSTGGAALSGEKSYPGYAVITRTSAGNTGIFQSLAASVKSGENYRLTLSLYGIGQIESAGAYLYDTANPGVNISNMPVFVSGNSSWNRVNIDLTVTSDASQAGIFIYIIYPGSGTHVLQIDEVRMSKLAAVPQIKSSVKTTLGSMGVKSIRWPGGTLVDFFDWKNSIGTLQARGENKASSGYHTVSFGLHEFLDLCEELNVTPLIQVNYLNGETEAAELVEYILGSDTTVQGAIRKLNGRTDPWQVIYFEIGNEPSENYKDTGTTRDTPLTYSAAVKPVISAMRNKAASLGTSIQVSGIIEPSFQLPSWMQVFAENPDAAYNIIRMLYYWNTDVLGASGFGNVDFLDGHFYGYREYDSSLTESSSFVYAMAGGAVLEKTLDTKISPLSLLPVWITEFHIFPEDKTTKAIQTSMMMDFRSGLAIADIMFSIINNNIEGAHLWNLSQPWFGAIRNTDTGLLRPAGLAFKMISPVAGEEKLNVTIDNNETVTTPAESGNTPAGLTYKLVSVIATRNAATGKPRILLLNRSYSSDKIVNITFDSTVSGNADVYLLNNSSLTADNESGENVTIVQSSTSFTEPFSVTIPAHSLIRIDMK